MCRAVNEGIIQGPFACGARRTTAVHLARTFAGALVLALAATAASAASTKYVSTSGVDAPGGGTQAAPYRSIGYGLTQLQSGDTLMVFDGTYADQANFVNDGLHAIPDGTVAADTQIRAVNAFRVRIQNIAPTAYYESPLRVRGNHIRVDGFIFDLRDTVSTPLVGELGGSYNRVTRSIFRRQGTVDQYGGWLYVGGHHQLVEDVGGVGAARYGFSSGGPTDTSHHIIFRRVVGRFDFSPSSQPKATFNAYGTDSGWGVHDILYQNCIAIDGQRGPSTGEEHYGAWYFPKNMDAASIVGSIALNNAVAYAGMFVQEQQGRRTVVKHSVAWNSVGGSSVRWNGSGSITLENLTVGAQAWAMTNSNSTGPVVLMRSLFSGNTQLFQSNSGFADFSNSAFAPAGQAYGVPVITASGPLRYLPDASNGTGLTDVGATILKRTGRSGALWDEPGYDELTTENLWPWPYEDELKAVFAQPNTPLAGNVPASNNSVRGFTVATDAYGQPMTLTRYVWQFLGQQIPASIYADADLLFRNGFE